MLISPAYAQGAGGQGGFDIVALLPLVLIFVVFYFLLIRPQQKRMKEHREMVNQLRRGDRVVTAGGIIGQVTKVVNDEELQVEIAEGTRVRVMRQTVQQVLSKTEPAKKEGGDKQAAANDTGDKAKGMLGKLLGGGAGAGSSSSSSTAANAGSGSGGTQKRSGSSQKSSGGSKKSSGGGQTGGGESDDESAKSS